MRRNNAMAKKTKEEQAPQSVEERLKTVEEQFAAMKKEWDKYKVASPFYKATVPPSLKPQKPK